MSCLRRVARIRDVVRAVHGPDRVGSLAVPVRLIVAGGADALGDRLVARRIVLLERGLVLHGVVLLAGLLVERLGLGEGGIHLLVALDDRGDELAELLTFRVLALQVVLRLRHPAPVITTALGRAAAAIRVRGAAARAVVRAALADRVLDELRAARRVAVDRRATGATVERQGRHRGRLAHEHEALEGCVAGVHPRASRGDLRERRIELRDRGVLARLFGITGARDVRRRALLEARVGLLRMALDDGRDQLRERAADALRALRIRLVAGHTARVVGATGRRTRRADR